MLTPATPESSAGNALARAILGALVMAIALGAAIVAGEFVQERLNPPDRITNVIRGVITALIAVSAIVLLRLRYDRRPMSGIGLPGWPGNLRTFGLGAGITLASGIGVGAIAWIAGWLEITSVNWDTLFGWLAYMALSVFLYEALPEELTFRGYAFTHLRDRFGDGTAIGIGLVLFCAMPTVVGAIHWALAPLAGLDQPPFRPLPEGESPLTYFTFLVAFGYVLHVARIATGSLWTGIGLHLAFITFNRLVTGTDASDTGLAIDLNDTGRLIILPAYLTLTVIILSIMANHEVASPDTAPTIADQSPED